MTNKPASKWLLLHSTMTNVGGVVIITHFVYKYIINGCVSVGAHGLVVTLATSWSWRVAETILICAWAAPDNRRTLWVRILLFPSAQHSCNILQEAEDFLLALFLRFLIHILVKMRATRSLGNVSLRCSSCSWWWQPVKNYRMISNNSAWFAIFSGLGSCQWFEKVMSQSWADSSPSPAQVRLGWAPADCMSN